ncbi:GTP-binding protein [Clostridium carnis]
MRIKIDVFSGFLGAGKTVLIKKLLKENFYNENIVIIENEFGEVSIDGTILKESNINVKEINAGCICCSVTGDFNNSIKEVIEKYHPQRILIEPSGVAKLSEILDICKNHELKDNIYINMVITVIDISRFSMYITNFNDFYKNQIINAKTILLTRTENLSHNELLEMTKKVKEINSKAPIITTNLDILNANQIINIAEKPSENLLIKSFSLAKGVNGKLLIKSKNKSTANETFESFSIESPKIFSKEVLISLLDKFNDSNSYGTILRAKGIVKTDEKDWVQFDYLPKEITLNKTSPDYTSRICIIGTNLNKIDLNNLFLS